ncbi:hypothetical protein LSM04_006277 [Trypanosoma melophagium]|uniref:uncharacterized protein n=1 Tax=Trypanosoma melophagium TaxID=715481 RepID=UPI003519EA5E|nr:hypothetical protein LSM04_006277 [Trypanosoma melophagium]
MSLICTSAIRSPYVQPWNDKINAVNAHPAGTFPAPLDSVFILRKRTTGSTSNALSTQSASSTEFSSSLRTGTTTTNAGVSPMPNFTARSPGRKSQSGKPFALPDIGTQNSESSKGRCPEKVLNESGIIKSNITQTTVLRGRKAGSVSDVRHVHFSDSFSTKSVASSRLRSLADQIIMALLSLLTLVFLLLVIV